jgi:biopolymer transport protein ExbD
MTFSFSMGLAGLLAATQLAPELLAQKEGAPAEAAARLATLPTSSQGKATATPDIVVTLQHEAPAGAKCADPKVPCADAGHWAVEIAQASKPGAVETAPIDRVDELRAKLEAAAATKAKQRGDGKVSDATLSIRAAPGTPYSAVQAVIATAAKSTIHAIELAVTPQSGVTEQRLPVPLPVDEKPVLEQDAKTSSQDIPMRLTWNTDTNRCVRYFGKVAIAADDAGDEQLQELIAKGIDGWRRLGNPEAPAVLTIDHGVPWQQVVRVIDLCHAASVRVRFAAPGSPAKVDAPRDTKK